MSIGDYWCFDAYEGINICNDDDDIIDFVLKESFSNELMLSSTKRKAMIS